MVFSDVASLGVTEAEVEQYPEMVSLDDKLLYSATDSCRKALVGLHGTNLQMIAVILSNEHGEMFMHGQACLFLVKNKIKPMAKDIQLLAMLIAETARRLGEGDMHAVNRRHQLTHQGVLKPTLDDDTVPEDVRANWVRPCAPCQ